MRRFAFACSLFLATEAFAGEPRWIFKPGQTFTYECRSDFDWTVKILADGPLTGSGNPTPGGTGGATDGGGSTGGGGGGGC